MTSRPTVPPVANQFADKMAVVYRHLQKRSPWTESNDMPWEDEMICGIDILFQRATESERRLAEVEAETMNCLTCRSPLLQSTVNNCTSGEACPHYRYRALAPRRGGGKEKA